MLTQQNKKGLSTSVEGMSSKSRACMSVALISPSCYLPKVRMSTRTSQASVPSVLCSFVYH